MSTKTKSPSIEFVVDEVADMLLAYEHLQESDVGENLKEILQLPLSNIRQREPAEIQRTLGRLVLTFLNSRSRKGLNLPRDLEDEAKLDAQHYAQAPAISDADAPEAKYELAINLINQGMSSGSWSMIESGEALLKEAISAGLPAAIEYQAEVWTLVRPRLENKFNYKKD